MTKEKREKPKIDTEEEQRSKYKNSPLLLEYKMAQQMHNYYGRLSWEIASILVAGSLAMVGFSLQSTIIAKKPILFLGIAVAVTLIMLAWYLLFRRIAQLVDIHIARLLQIEEKLHFHQHEYVHKANKGGHVIIEGRCGRKCYDLSGLRGRDSVKLLIISLIVSVWIIAILLFIFQ